MSKKIGLNFQKIPFYAYVKGMVNCYISNAIVQNLANTVVVVFPQAPFRVTNVPGHASAGIIQLCNCTLAP
jgi:hypothetical protein